MRLVHALLPILGGVIVLLASQPAAASAAFCGYGCTSKEVRSWNNHHLATPSGQHRIDQAVTSEITHNPPALAPFITQGGRVVKERARGIAAHPLAWFKQVYLKCPDGTPGCKAMRQCLIAAYTTYVVDRGVVARTQEARVALGIHVQEVARTGPFVAAVRLARESWST